MIGARLGALSAVLAMSAPVGSIPATVDVPQPGYETSRIVEVDAYDSSFGGERRHVTAYRNDAYRCGRHGAFPFVVVEPLGEGGERRPLWVILHGGGAGHYGDDQRYVSMGGGESNNDAESTGQLLALLYDYVDVDRRKDTFIADRLAAGDRFVLGSLCDHDLYLGVGQPYPHNPHHDDTVDGLLANLAMVDAITSGTETVPRRATSSLWTLGASAGAFGAYALAHNLWARGVDVDGLILDSGLLVARTASASASEWVTDHEMIAKHGPYLAEPSLWVDEAIVTGFDVPLFDTVEEDDAFCRDPGEHTGCAWVHAGLAQAIDAAGDPVRQQVHVYPGATHIATRKPGTEVQGDLREWYRAVTLGLS